MASQATLQDILQAEFSPPLDTSLIAAIVADYVSGSESSNDVELRQLREVLSNLAASAEKDLVDEGCMSGFSQLHISPTSIVDDSSSSYDLSTTDNSGYTSTGSDASGQQPFSSALGFLKAVFPHLPSDKLQNAIASHGGDSEQLDMEAVVNEILTGEYVRELEERGLDETESAALGYEAPWETVKPKKGGKQKKYNKKGTTITLVDIRQQQHARPVASSSQPAPPDPWTQLASVASHLSTLIPTHPPSFFQSVFHSPQHPTPAHALRAAIVQIAQSYSQYEQELTAEETPSLYNMLEIITTWPKYADLNVEERDQLLEDALFALRATKGDPNAALDVVSLLIDLDSDYSSKEYSLAVYHQPAAKLPPRATTKLPTGPPPIPPPPNISRRPSPLPSPTGEKPRAPVNVWKTVPIKPSPDEPHPLSGVIRAYTSPTPPNRKVRGSGNAMGKGGKGDVGELQMAKKTVAKRRAWELSEQRRAALKEASKAWQKGNSRNHGGEVAFYFAERARELQQQQQMEQLAAAREMVMRTRKINPHSEAIDLHGTVVSEAVAIVREYLAEHGATNARPLKVITGRGSHSRNGVAVLGPAVKNALTADGWRVDTCDGGLVIRGRAR
ncbi:Smr-domain-containing protein [Trametes coccinea BRFM310]|uniref:Smr-domain-containing protein n=1 Tax=Trametes coccinea (strain BRFM310) TaxID=1353009 RepID=A0A1Y2IW55_TRAC3|nr:Smr-domain-containing protein [Trametes coccinea BRFM310]